MKKLFATLGIATLGLLMVGGAAYANSSINHTGCHHGRSNKPCRPDPQPTHGNDCSNRSGGNQDHCKGTTTTTMSTTTTVPTVDSTTTTLSGQPTTSTTTSTGSGVPTTTTTASEPPAPQPPVLVDVPATGPPTVPESPSAASGPDAAPALTTLPRTGLSGELMAAGVFLLLAGLAFRIVALTLKK